MSLYLHPPSWRQIVLAILALFVLLTHASCTPPFTRTIYVPEGQAVQLRAPIKNAAVWCRDAEGKKIPSTKTLAEGQYVLSMPAEPAPLKPVELE
jgi:hypothetical protein